MSDSKSVITIRVIKNFEYRAVKNIILNVDLSTVTVGELKKMCLEEISTKAGFVPFRNVEYVINFGNEGFLDNEQETLDKAGILNETEISLFNRKAYDEFEKNPKFAW
ncbi:hypothetical protein BB560_006594 [Smittium megazygosporum]|uniref:Ubiquitin-like domain-containing protein n=1 Tax=Smittium megazygosporum TaxID=133381 RepID=A0A2T9Y3B6_9FUNG|nr:hypothetical protein BB560_006594 [Smittium megazygosporum]